MVEQMTDWRKSACVLCHINCGIQVALGGEDGRQMVRIKGDKDHPASQGYTCNKVLQLDYYQNGRDRLTSPLRRRKDGGFEAVDWDTAITEVAARLAQIRDELGGDKILYYGGGGQGNHLGGGYGSMLRRAFDMRFRSNALAQEKTGFAWVAQRMFGALVHGDFEHCQVALFVGKNAWHSHGIHRARAVLKSIARDPGRTMIVIDPRRSETAELADIHLQVKPGSDAWCLAAMLAVIVQEGLVAADWLAEHAVGMDPVAEWLSSLSVTDYAARCGIAEDQLRATARTIAGAESMALYEDLGVQMAPNSTLCSYLDNLLILLTGNFANQGGNNVPSRFVPLYSYGKADRLSDENGYASHFKYSPVTGARILGDLIPCNVLPDEILGDHPDRFRGMVVESANPAHSLADSKRMREAMSALDFLVVIDVAMTETAELADYVLPAASQYEKWEATFFNFEFPDNYFHLRAPLLSPTPGTLPEAEIHARIIEAAGIFDAAELAPLAEAAAAGRMAFAMAFGAAMTSNRKVAAYAPYVLYRTLGPTLPDGAAPAAALWGAAQMCAMKYGASVQRAGHADGNALFEALLAGRSGVVFSVDEPAVSLERVTLPDGKLNLMVPEMLDELRAMDEAGLTDLPDELPLVLSAGERRSHTANTVIRDPGWLKSNNATSLSVSPADAGRLSLSDGGQARLITRRDTVNVLVQVDDRMQQGHVSLPNGLGLAYPDASGERRLTGVSVNELTATEDRDAFAGTPWHKYVPARLEPPDAKG